MKNRHFKRITVAILVLILIFSFSSCGNKSGNTIDEPDEITAEYLYGEYAEQLIRDGAEVTLGTVDVDTDGNGLYSLTTENMVIVESDLSDAGYYVADANIETTAWLDPEARIAYISEKGTEPEILSVDEFMAIVDAEDFDPIEEGNEKIFDVYTMGDTVMMVLARELPVIE